MQDLKTTIKTCFENMYIVARFDAKNNYKDYKKRGEQYNIARALVFLNGVSKNPDKYFSVEHTNNAWNTRVEEYLKNGESVQQDVQKYGIEYMRRLAKGSLVAGPGDIVFDKVSPVMRDTGLLDFCKEVQNFYYKDLYKNTYVNERFIGEYAHKIFELASIAKQANPLKRGIMKMFYNYEK